MEKITQSELTLMLMRHSKWVIKTLKKLKGYDIGEIQPNESDRIILSGYDLSGLDFSRGLLWGAKLINCNLRNANFNNCDWKSCDFTGSDITGTVIDTLTDTEDITELMNKLREEYRNLLYKKKQRGIVDNDII